MWRGTIAVSRLASGRSIIFCAAIRESVARDCPTHDGSRES